VTRRVLLLLCLVIALACGVGSGSDAGIDATIGDSAGDGVVSDSQPFDASVDCSFFSPTNDFIACPSAAKCYPAIGEACCLGMYRDGSCLVDGAFCSEETLWECDQPSHCDGGVCCMQHVHPRRTGECPRRLRMGVQVPAPWAKCEACEPFSHAILCVSNADCPDGLQCVLAEYNTKRFGVCDY